MSRILQQHLVATVGELLNFLRQSPIKTPEPRACSVLHRSVQRPASRSSRASWISQSSRPAASSSAIWRSHAAASNSEYQARNVAISSGDSCRIAASISSTVLMNASIPPAASAANGSSLGRQAVIREETGNSPIHTTAEPETVRGIGEAMSGILRSVCACGWSVASFRAAVIHRRHA